MATLLDILVWIAAFWLLTLFLSSRINFQRFNILVAPMILVWRTERVGKIFNKIFHNRLRILWSNIGEASAILYLTLLIITPILLIINLILALFSEPSVILGNNPINIIDSSIAIVFIPIFLAIFIHEYSKMILAASEGAEIEKAGLMLIFVILAPFVQYTNKSLNLLKRRSRIKILSIGMLANFLMVLIFIPILANQTAIVTNFYEEPSGALIISVEPDSPAGLFISPGEVIIGIQRIEISGVRPVQNISSAAEFITNMRNIPSGERFFLVLSNARLIITGVDPPENSKIIAGSYIGVEVYDYRDSKYSFLSPMLPFYFQEFLVWSISINLILGIFSILPFPLSDGRKIMDEVLESLGIESFQKVMIKRIAVGMSSLLILLNIYYTV